MAEDANFADLLIVGSGAAGLMAACVAGGTSFSVALVTDGSVGRSNSVMAQGCLHVPVDTPEGRSRMLHDMTAAGGPSVIPALAERFIAEIGPTIDLLGEWGLDLDVDEQGSLIRRLAGAMSEPRIVGTGDRIGPSVVRVLRDRLSTTSVRVMANSAVSGLRAVDNGFAVELPGGSVLTATTVIIATGGDTFRHSRNTGEPCTNPRNSNADMSQILLAMGIPRVDDGVYQWQPFGLLDAASGTAGASRPCVPESVVGHGVRIVDRHGAEVVAADSGRAVVTAEMKRAIADGRGIESNSGEMGLWLTLTDVPDGVLRNDYGHLAAVLDRHDLFGRDVLIAPYLHYQLGGFEIFDDCSCVVPGLYLAGEITGGIHGKSRLMGNGLTDSLVHGRRAAMSALAMLATDASGPGE